MSLENNRDDDLEPAASHAPLPTPLRSRSQGISPAFVAAGTFVATLTGAIVGRMTAEQMRPEQQCQPVPSAENSVPAMNDPEALDTPPEPDFATTKSGPALKPDVAATNQPVAPGGVVGPISTVGKKTASAVMPRQVDTSQVVNPWPKSTSSQK